MDNQEHNSSEHAQPTRRRNGAWVWLAPALLAVIAGAAVLDVAFADTDGPLKQARENTRMLAVSGKLTADTHGMFLVDLDNQTIVVYQYVSGRRRLKMAAARTFAMDRRLKEYNTGPSLDEIQKMLARQDRLDAADGEE